MGLFSGHGLVPNMAGFLEDRTRNWHVFLCGNYDDPFVLTQISLNIFHDVF